LTFLIHSSAHSRDLHSFPTRRSSDLREQKDIITAIGNFSDRVVVMSELARDILTSVYAVPNERVAIIPHGVPDMPFGMIATRSRSEEHTSELQSQSNLVCRLLLEKKK